ncbi:MAG: hypothetical protein V1859_10880 [archaeon]
MKKTMFVALAAFLLAALFANAEVLIVSLNKGEYSAGESVLISGYTFDDNLNAKSDSTVTIYLNDTLLYEGLPASDGLFNHTIINISVGSYKVTANTSDSTQVLTFEATAAALTPSYIIIASSLNVPYTNPLVNFTVQKYLGDTLTSDSYTYNIYYSNGTLFNSSTYTSGSS